MTRVPPVFSEFIGLYQNKRVKLPDDVLFVMTKKTYVMTNLAIVFVLHSLHNCVNYKMPVVFILYQFKSEMNDTVLHV